MTLFPLPCMYGKEILRTEVGSTLHGTGLEGGEDHDEMGIFVEYPPSTIGLSKLEHYQFRTAQEGERSKPGDTDLIVYSLRKWCRLALKGNPSVLLLLFAPENKTIIKLPHGEILRENAHWFASKLAGKAFFGYMQRQRSRMSGGRGKAGRVRNNPDGSIDWKYAMHMLRLGYQGYEYLTSGRITLPIPGEYGDVLRKIRKGELPIEDVLEAAFYWENMLKTMIDQGPLPDKPDYQAVNDFCIQAHLDVWKEKVVR